MTQKVLVTGANGFIGSHLVEELVARNYKVLALNEYNSFGNQGWLSEIEGNYEIKDGDIRDKEFIEQLIAKVDIVVNLAALIAIPHSFEARRSYFDTNLMGTFNICEATLKHGKRLIHISTSEVYGTPKVLPITEFSEINPQSPYAASKAAADNLLMSYCHSFDINAMILRPFNTFGPRQSLRAIIPTIISQLLNSSSEIEIGNILPKRDFTYVKDTVVAIELALKSDIKKEIVQLGTGSAISVGELVGLLQEIIGVEKMIKLDSSRNRPNTSEVEILLSDPSKAAKVLKWRPKWDFRDGLVETINWVRSRPDYIQIGSRYIK